MSCMEAIFKSLLQKQGYNHICLLDPDKQIWGYEKDGEYHFCKEDLTEVDRAEVGLTHEVEILAIRNEKTECIKTDFTYLPAAIILDKQNKILKKLPSSSSSPYYVFKRINANSVIVVKGIYEYGYSRIPNRKWEEKNIWAAYQFGELKDSFVEQFNQIDSFKDTGAFIYIDGKLHNGTDLYLYYEDYYFFIANGNLEVYHPLFGVVFNAWKKDGDLYNSPDAILWICKERGAFFIHNRDSQTGMDEVGKVFVTPLGSANPLTFRLSELVKSTNKDETKAKERVYLSDALCSEDYLLVPLSSSFGSLLSIHVCSNSFSTKILDIDIRRSTLTFQNGIIKTVDQSHYTDDYRICYFDADGNVLNEKRDNWQFLIYWKYAYEDNQYKEKYGVLRKEDCKQILKPIYSRISFYDNNIFEVELSNNVNGDNQSMKGLYHAEKGFLLPIGIEYHHPEYWNNITGISINTAEAYCFNIFSFGEHEGLLLGSEKVLEPIYDSIEGFSFWEKFNEDEDSWYFDRQEAERKTKEYQPLSVILYKDGKRGLFIDKEHVIEPVFDRIECCKVLKGHAYFEAQQGEKKSIISDDIVFNEKYQELYDNIVKEDYGVIVYFNVYKDGKIGMISTDTNYSIPIQYEELQVFSKCYIGDGYFYTRNGQKLFCKDDYELDAELKYLVFKNIHYADYAFVTLSGDMLKSESINKDIISVKGNGDYVLAKYSTKDKCFIKEEENNWIPYDDYPTDDDIKMGLMEAYNGDPEALWNND